MNFALNSSHAGGLHMAPGLFQLHWTLMSMSGPNASAAKAQSNCGEEGDDGYDECKGSLRSVIETQIIPRLLQSHAAVSASNAQAFHSAYAPTDSDVEAFANLCVDASPEVSMAFVKQLQRDGVSNDDLFLKLMAPAARCLGTWWEEDKTDFTVVTVGLLRMQQITHELGYDYHAAPQSVGRVRRVMLASAPGSQHILGLVMVSEFFRKEGWQVVVEIANTEKEILHAASNEWFDLIGFSVGLVEQLPTLRDLISRTKKASRNPDTPVLLGGPAFFNTDASAESLGANGISLDALHGLKLASELVDPQNRVGL
jgi:methanogenic corrinoid protein MtbC1